MRIRGLVLIFPCEVCALSLNSDGSSCDEHKKARFVEKLDSMLWAVVHDGGKFLIPQA